MLIFTPRVPTPQASSPSCTYEMVCSTLAQESSPFSADPYSRAITFAAGPQCAEGCTENVESAAHRKGSARRYEHLGLSQETETGRLKTIQESCEGPWSGKGLGDV